MLENLRTGQPESHLLFPPVHKSVRVCVCECTRHATLASVFPLKLQTFGYASGYWLELKSSAAFKTVDFAWVFL